ncbi:MAG: hypothetical protein JOY96_10095 [Verrucomicrobia bacterium]|nr:hypothetical protein [Verrucomicrobiota bacterium]
MSRWILYNFFSCDFYRRRACSNRVFRVRQNVLEKLRDLIGLALPALIVAGCDNQKIEVYRIPKEQAAIEVIAPAQPSSPARWTKPDDWQEQALSEMRLASYKVTGPDGAVADVSVTAFPGDAGGLVANVNRWRGQLHLKPLNEEELASTVQNLEVDGNSVRLVDFQGSGEVPHVAGILGAVLETPDRTWFIKMTGNHDFLEQQRENFLRFVNSFRFGSNDSDASASRARSTNEK